jgi:hypothetical protein
MARILPVGKESKGAAGVLLAALPAMGALLTALTVTGDVVGRMARNHPLASLGAFGCATVAVFLGAVAAYGLNEGSRWERRLLQAGLGVLGAGLLLGVYAGVRTWGDRVEPSITVTPRSGSAVTVSVRGSGLRSSDHLVVEVEQLVRGLDPLERLTWQPGEPLYGASLGPDESGDVEHTVTLTLPAGDFDDLGARAWVGDEPKPCYGGGNTTGCVRVHIPRPQERPQLTTTWETYVKAPRLAIRLKARNLARRPSLTMTLRVYGVAGAERRPLAEWLLAPDAAGTFDRRLSVVIGRGFTDVCVVASLATSAPACPAAPADGTVWAMLAVPPLK